MTTDQKGLILSARRGARSGSYQLPLNEALGTAIDEHRERLAEAEAEVEELQEEDAERTARVESALPVREIQARLRQGRTVQDVAKAAGVETSWVERFAAPVFAEQAEVMAKVRKMSLKRARLGRSAHPIGDSMRHNLAERGLALSPEEFASAWSTRQLADGRWAVRFRFRYRGKDQSLRFDLDESKGAVVAADRLSGQLGYVAPTPLPAAPERPSKAEPETRPSAKRATATTGFRAEEPAVRPVSRPAKERQRASLAMRKGAAKRAVETERAAARKTKEKREAAVKRARQAKVEEARRQRERAVAERARAAAAKKAAADKAKRRAARQAEAQARRAEAALLAAEEGRTADKAPARKKATSKRASTTRASKARSSKALPAPARTSASRGSSTKASTARAPSARSSTTSGATKGASGRSASARRASTPPASAPSGSNAEAPPTPTPTPAAGRASADRRGPRSVAPSPARAASVDPAPAPDGPVRGRPEPRFERALSQSAPRTATPTARPGPARGSRPEGAGSAQAGRRPGSPPARKAPPRPGDGGRPAHMARFTPDEARSNSYGPTATQARFRAGSVEPVDGDGVRSGSNGAPSPERGNGAKPPPANRLRRRRPLQAN